MSESPWNFAGESTHVGVGDAVTLVDGATFMVSGRTGDVLGHGSQGLFTLDTRVLSGWVVTVGGNRVQPLSVTPNGPFSTTFLGRVDIDGSVDAPVVVIQRRSVGQGMREDLEVRNYGTTRLELEVELSVAADFRPLFDVKTRSEADGRLGAVEPTPSGVWISPVGPAADETTIERTILTSTARPTGSTSDGAVIWSIVLEPNGVWRTCLQVSVSAGGKEIEPSYGCNTEVDDAIPVQRLRHWRASSTQIETDHQGFSGAFNQSIDDLGVLRIFDPEHIDRVVVAAGAPWFMTLFGRDSILASWMALPVDQALARGVLAELADAQGTKVDAGTEEQPGRILHEVRFDRMSARLLGGTGTYYGSIDSTPLFVMLVAELARWTGSIDDVSDLMPAVDRALDWIEEYGDRDGDGFVEYERSGPHGLENQGWKDSWDGIRHADGTVAVAPIALCEVQGYVYAAYRGRATLARFLEEPDAVARRFEERADRLKERFDAAFWVPDDEWYAVGIDRSGEQIRSLTSNIGHLLWTGIVPQNRADRLAELLVSPTLFSGWGIRTLAADAAGYNPLSYHCGSVWPHDTALAIAGLARYRCDDAMQRLALGLIDASTFTGGRLPELFGGFARSDVPAPVPYPASCSPQAWAAASSLLVLRSMLGLEPDLLNTRVSLRPRLPEGVRRIRLTGVPIGHHRLDLDVTEGEVDVLSDADLTVDVQ